MRTEPLKKITRRLPGGSARNLQSDFFASAYAQMDPRQQRGLTLATANCARCHSIDKVTASPLTLAPPFRELHNRYPVESLEEALGEGIVTGHPNMPEFRLDPGQVGDLISYLKSLER